MPNSSPHLPYGFRYVLPLCLISFAGVAHAASGGDDAVDGDVLSPSPAPIPASTATNNEIAPAAITQKDSDDLDWAPVSNAKLDGVRGGFDLGNGLMASLGIQQVTYINGNLVISNNITIPNVANITSQQATALATVLNTVNVVQNGPGNTFDTSSSGQNMAAVTGQSSAATTAQSNAASTEQSTAAAQIVAASMGQNIAAATVIQNTLNNQAIRSLTTLNISVNTLDALRSMNLQSTLQSAQFLSPGR
ncbi:MAG: hypothetical protein WA777_20795 [Rhodanobacter sp.]